jgi:hypothetical protein
LKPGGTKNWQALSNLGAELAVLKHNTCAGTTGVMQRPAASITQNTTQETQGVQSPYIWHANKIAVPKKHFN